MRKKYEFFEHTADMGVRAFGEILTEAFENIAYGMFKLMYKKIENVKPTANVKIECHSYDVEPLLVEWLNSLLYESDVRNIIFSHFYIKDLNLTTYTLIAEASGQKYSKKFKPQIEVKAATYSELKIRQINNVYVAQCVLDI